MVIKEQVIRLFLKFVSRYVSLDQSKLATLGGRGLEAKIWKDLSIPKENGWLIERSPRKNGALIRNNQYRTHNQLGTFDKILAGHGEEYAFIDGFHLDLCGTFSDQATTDFRPVLPVVLNGRGRCLAITVADARRNMALEQWPDFLARGEKLFGEKKQKEIYKRLITQQERIPSITGASSFVKPFDPDKATKREFGLLVELVELFREQDLSWIPSVVERYVYVSRYQNRPFRMRTYFFHFEQKKLKMPEIAFANIWADSQLFFAHKEKFSEVRLPHLTIPNVESKKNIKGKGKGDITMSQSSHSSKLAALVQVLGGPEQAEYTQLIKDRQQLQSILAAFENARGMNMNSSESNGHDKKNDVHKVKKIRRVWQDLTDFEKIEWQINTLEIKLQMGNDKYREQWSKLLKASFGYYNEDLGRSCGRALARVNGQFRPIFEDRVKKVFGDNAQPYLDRLAQLPSNTVK